MASPAQSSVLDALLAPIANAANPAGERLPEDDRAAIEKARQFDDGGAGVWQRERVESDWYRVRDLTREALSSKSKDLSVAAWYTEAQARIEQLPGIIEGLKLIAGLIDGYWDGLFPALVDGDVSYRARPIDALNRKLTPLLRQSPLTGRSDSGVNYCLLDYYQARKAGLEANLRDRNGNIDAKRQADRKEVVDAGGITGELWEAAVKSTRRAHYEQFSAQLNEAWDSLLFLVKLMDEKRFFGTNDAPSLGDIRAVLEEIRTVITPILRQKREEEPDAPKAAPPGSEEKTEKKPVNAPVSRLGTAGPSGDAAAGSWEHAQALVRAGQVDEAIEEMTRLGAQEHGRNRFLRKLDLAEICVGRERFALAMVVLEDLDEQIKTLNLAAWESPELVGRVWGQLYRLYRKVPEKQALAAELYLRLCRLDPWQGLKWTAE